MNEPPPGPAVSDAAILAWVTLNRAQRHTVDRVEADLKAAGLPPLAWYDVLLELWREPEGRLRQSEIERATLFAQYNVSRLVDRLIEAGLVRREACPDDARVRWVVITEAGRALRPRMWAVYAAAVEPHLGTKLTSDEARQLAILLRRLAR